MKKTFYGFVLFFALVLCLAQVTHADDKDLSYKGSNEISTITVDAAADFVPVFDTSSNGTPGKATLVTLQGGYADLTAASTLTTADCGKTFGLNSATEFATTLPAPTAGCRFTFYVKAAPSGASYTILTASSANIFIGHMRSADLNAASDGDSSTADDTITITDAKAVVGDQVILFSDGTSWYYLGSSVAFDALIATQAS